VQCFGPNADCLICSSLPRPVVLPARFVVSGFIRLSSPRLDFLSLCLTDRANRHFTYNPIIRVTNQYRPRISPARATPDRCGDGPHPGSIRRANPHSSYFAGLVSGSNFHSRATAKTVPIAIVRNPVTSPKL
jgi:hypothetical protein